MRGRLRRWAGQPSRGEDEADRPRYAGRATPAAPGRPEREQRVAVLAGPQPIGTPSPRRTRAVSCLEEVTGYSPQWAPACRRRRRRAGPRPLGVGLPTPPAGESQGSAPARRRHPVGMRGAGGWEEGRRNGTRVSRFRFGRRSKTQCRHGIGRLESNSKTAEAHASCGFESHLRHHTQVGSGWSWHAPDA